MNKTLIAVLSGFVAAGLWADPVVSDVKIAQQWPLSTDVKVTFNLKGVSEAVPVNITLDFFNDTTALEKSEDYHNALRGDVYGLTTEGAKTIFVDVRKALDTGTSVPNVFMKFRVEVSAALSSETNFKEVLYKIFDLDNHTCTDVTRIDLLNGKYGTYETSFQRIGSDFKTSLSDILIWTGVTNNDLYRTSKLVMRKIPAKDQVWTIGSPDGEMGKNYQDEGGRENQHTVQLTEDYFIGVFELTYAQYMKYKASCSEKPAVFAGVTDPEVRPIQGIPYRAYRGSSGETGMLTGERVLWPTNSVQHDVSAASVFGQMRTKFGVKFDFPTEAQWEYACRAGTTTGLNSGYDITTCTSAGLPCPRVKQVGWNECCDDYPEGTEKQEITMGSSTYTMYPPMKVGLKLPNAWGLYDMHGNVEEFCLNVYTTDIRNDWDSTKKANVTRTSEPLVDPVGPYAVQSTKTYYTTRGGSTTKNNRYIRSAHREAGGRHYAKDRPDLGCRLVCPVEN